MVEYAQHVVSQGLTCHTGEKQKEKREEQKNKGKQVTAEEDWWGCDESAGKSTCSSLVTGVGSPETT